MAMGKQKKVDRSTWLESLLDPATAVRFKVYGYNQLVADWQYVDRQVPEHLVYYIVHNELSAEVAGAQWRLPAGSFCLLPPGTRHTFRHVNPHRPITLYFFRINLIHKCHALTLDTPPLFLPAASSLRESFDRLHDERQSAGPQSDLRIKARLMLLFSNAFHLMDKGPALGSRLNNRQRQQLYDRVGQHTAVSPQPQDLAACLGLTGDHFSRVFRRTFGMSCRRWLVIQRINQAAAALADTTLNITQTAARLGYPDVYQFSRQFKLIMGKSPKAYRASQTTNPSTPPVLDRPEME